mmetsp:Transcript_3571/g.6072  ORF Transcript_3571/g.6072 Transcript_3571/m.6072 type:complete len:126 (+) Transcript_3571:134-511(+)|eukprot:CAMPEP_0168607690 /NCGR_PEP_ID=MMETSP0449_2-20121227/196_1 /TAXON_ID=1082188 /ORGANISM="Strombidium rassoulzadegani, Strain ras09" /LENGTH=125 /DNA_ID=CAMNT_0008647561 /DNA_START=102 /DNA_END=479 /DNA_ORIENTATION=-
MALLRRWNILIKGVLRGETQPTLNPRALDNWKVLISKMMHGRRSFDAIYDAKVIIPHLKISTQKTSQLKILGRWRKLIHGLLRGGNAHAYGSNDMDGRRRQVITKWLALANDLQRRGGAGVDNDR